MYALRREAGFTLVELLVVILILGLLIGMSVPNYRLIVDRARTTALESNMRQVSAAIILFFAENGYYADDFYEDGYGYVFDGGVKDERMGRLPTNPYTGKVMDTDEFNTDEYENESDVVNTSEEGPNDDWGYQAGEMRYATYTPPGANHPTVWGLIGFDKSGRSMRRFDSDGNQVIVVLHQ